MTDKDKRIADLEVSIHAPTRGATSVTVFIDIESLVSIHAPTRGATYDGLLPFPELVVSIHAPTRGATA